jgi:transcriptional regulator with XRE-family HTH domain
MPEYGRLLSDSYRYVHGLLTSEEIRSRRQHLNMSQQEFAGHLGVGIASVKRWEMGKIQDADSNRRILEKTQSPAYTLVAWGAHFQPIIDSTFQFYSRSRMVAREKEGVFSIIDSTGLPYSQPRYTGRT